MGMTRQEITRKLDEIVDFAGVERYVDTPVKRYSSGMTVRLGFAVAAFLEPEILVVDEVLAVGDAEFQKKAIGKMQDVSKGEGRTVLFVSHNMAAVRSLCSKGVLLENGQIVYQGNTDDTINLYLNKESLKESDNIKDRIAWKKHTITIDDIEINNSVKSFSTIASNQKELNVKIKGYTQEDILVDTILTFKNMDEVPMASLAEGHCKGKMQAIKSGKFELGYNIQLPKILSNGDYIIDLYLHHPMVEWFMKAPHCAEIHIDGYQEGFGRALNLKNEGFIGLETI